MAEILCGVCNTEPKKYKCPTCSIPYCSLPCFNLHKPTHPPSSTAPTAQRPSTPEIPQPPPPAPPPKYLRSKTDFSVIATDPRFQDLLKTHPTLLLSLQRVYAATIEPEPEDQFEHRSSNFRGRRGGDYRGRGRGRGFGDRGRGRGGRWGRGGRGHGDGNQGSRWTQKKGDNDALRLLKGFREGKESGKEKEGMAEFVRLVEEMFGYGGDKDGDGHGERMNVG